MKPTRTWKFLQALCRIATTLLFDLKVFGVERIPREGGVLVVCNHQSYLDPVLVAVRSRRPLGYMAKSELFGFKPFEWLIRSLGAFPVRQGAGDVGAMKEAIERLRQGEALTIFPEGSRAHDGNLLPIEPGIALMVRKAKVPVLPVVFDGAFRAWPKGRKIFQPAPVRVLYGRQMDLLALDRQQIIETIDRSFHQLLSQLRNGQVQHI